MASVLPQGAILDVLKKKMRQTKEEMEKYKEECEEYHKRLQVEINRREEVRVYILYYVFMYILYNKFSPFFRGENYKKKFISYFISFVARYVRGGKWGGGI